MERLKQTSHLPRVTRLVSTDETPMVWLPVQTPQAASTLQGKAAPLSRPPRTVSDQAGSSPSGGRAPGAGRRPTQDPARGHERALPAPPRLHHGSTTRRSRRRLP